MRAPLRVRTRLRRADRRLLVLASLGAVATTPVLAQETTERRGAAADAAVACRGRHVVGVALGAPVGALAGFLADLLVPPVTLEKPDDGRWRAALSGALLGVGVGLMGSDGSDACRRADGAYRPSVRLTGPAPIDHIAAGAKVRLAGERSGSDPVARWVVARRADTLLLSTDRHRARDTVAVAIGASRRLEVSDGRGNSSRAIVIGGTVLGAVVGSLVAYHGESPPDDRFCFIFCEATRGQAAFIGGRNGAMAGAGIGLLVARSMRTERWHPLVHDESPRARDRVGVRVEPSPRGVALSVRVRTDRDR